MKRTDSLELVICVDNEGNEASLRLPKIYEVIRDDDAMSEGLLRVIDESGEDYLFPEENFARIAPSSWAAKTAKDLNIHGPRILRSFAALRGYAAPPAQDDGGYFPSNPATRP